MITPSAALASFPYLPAEALRALRHFLGQHKDRIWARFGIVDAFSEGRNWYARTYLAINQGPIVVMIENYRSALLWKLFMGAPEVQAGLLKLGFNSPHLRDTPARAQAPCSTPEKLPVSRRQPGSDAIAGEIGRTDRRGPRPQ